MGCSLLVLKLMDAHQLFWCFVLGCSLLMCGATELVGCSVTAAVESVYSRGRIVSDYQQVAHYSGLNLCSASYKCDNYNMGPAKV